jgi:hypothetical protein
MHHKIICVLLPLQSNCLLAVFSVSSQKVAFIYRYSLRLHLAVLRTEARLSIIGIVGVFTATIVMFIGVANYGTALGQVADDTSSSSSSLTPEQRAATCDPNNPSSNLNPVNTTKSRICGISKTVQLSI